MKCHTVIGIDGDGDRIVFGDARGILTAGFVFIPILRACLIDGSWPNPVPVLYDPKVSPLALAEWGKLNARPVLFRNGHSQIKDYMKTIGAVAAAEESGHYYHRITMGDLTISAENSLMTILLFLGSLKKNAALMDQLWQLQANVFTTGEFNYQFDNDETRSRAMDAVIRRFVGENALAVTATPDGIDLQGTCLSKGVKLDPPSVQLESGWYRGFLRMATNEKSVVRSYFSAGRAAVRDRVEGQTRRILSEDFNGRVVR
jgi:phosphomannomutase